MRILAMLLAFLFAATTASALDIPRPKRDKEKKKEAKGETKKEETTTKKEEPKEEPAAASKEEEKPAPAAAAATAETVTEMTMSKEQWDAFKDYAVGDFVVYEFPAQPGMKQRQEVLEKTATSIVVVHKTTGGGPGQDTSTKMKYVLKEATEKVTVAGKEFNATKTDMSVGGALSSRTWSTKEVPLGGMLKSEGPGGQVYMVLSEFGKGK